jgi:hypothetical protein
MAPLDVVSGSPEHRHGNRPLTALRHEAIDRLGNSLPKWLRLRLNRRVTDGASA